MVLKNQKLENISNGGKIGTIVREPQLKRGQINRVGEDPSYTPRNKNKLIKIKSAMGKLNNKSKTTAKGVRN